MALSRKTLTPGEFYDSSDCRFFTGYKPCAKHPQCSRICPSYDPVEEAILIVHLGAMGAVLRSTSLLKSIKRKHPRAFLVWVTDKNTVPLLDNNPMIDLVTHSSDLTMIAHMQFGTAYIIDKSTTAVGIAQALQVHRSKGFTAHPHSLAILPSDSNADYLWRLGLDNHEKFFLNQKPEQQLVAEALSLPFDSNDQYVLKLTQREISQSRERRQKWLGNKSKRIIVGINTGCSPTIPAKKLSIEKQRVLAQSLVDEGFTVVLLGGGKEDHDRNLRIGQDLEVICSDTMKGLRDGMISMNAVDFVISGDSLGMHMAIALKKYTIAWFGPTCAHEIDLYGRGVKLIAPVPCGPCWKKSCQQSLMCYDLVDSNEIIAAVQAEYQNILTNGRNQQNELDAL